jgi:cohesin complex subunit SCC1
MFYSQLILAKKGPLGKIWLAAHFKKKLNKKQIYTTSIQQSVRTSPPPLLYYYSSLSPLCPPKFTFRNKSHTFLFFSFFHFIHFLLRTFPCAESVISPDEPLSLRVSGHLLLGIVRIFSQQCQYLVTDCNDARVKIMMAFHSKSGSVNLKEAEQMAAPGQLNMPLVFHDFNDQDDIFDDANQGDVNMRNMDLDSASDSDREGGGGWDTQKFLKSNIASSGSDINLSSRQYGQLSRSGSEMDEPHGFDDMHDDFGGSMDASFTGSRRVSSIGVGRDGTPLGQSGGLNDSSVGLQQHQQQRRRDSLGGGSMQDGNGDGYGGDFGGNDDFGNDDFYNEGQQDGFGGSGGGGLHNVDFGDDDDDDDDDNNVSGTPSRARLRRSLDGNGGVQWNLLGSENNSSPSDTFGVDGKRNSTGTTGKDGAANAPGSEKATTGARKKKKRRKMFKVDKNTEIPKKEYESWATTYYETCTRYRGVPTSLDHVNPDRYFWHDSGSEDDAEEDEQEEDADGRHAKKRLRQFHRGTAVYNHHQHKKRRLAKLNDVVPKPSLRRNMPSAILNMFESLCDTKRSLPLQHYQRPIPDSDLLKMKAHLHSSDVQDDQDGQDDASSPEMGRDDSHGGALDDDTFERASKRRRSLAANNDDDRHNDSNDDGAFMNEDDFGGNDDFGNDDDFGGNDDDMYGDGINGLEVESLHAGEQNKNDEERSAVHYDEPKTKQVKSMMRKLRRMSTSTDTSRSSLSSTSSSSIMDSSTDASSINFSRVVSTKTVKKREDAASCFFELLNLASSGKVNVRQDRAYGNIIVSLRSSEEDDSQDAAAEEVIA